jgi:hypothetical protein
VLDGVIQLAMRSNPILSDIFCFSKTHQELFVFLFKELKVGFSFALSGPPEDRPEWLLPLLTGAPSLH